MDEKQNQGGETAAADQTGQNPPVELGPMEKLEEDDSAGERTPGAQKPDSEVHNEYSPNTE